MFSIFQEVHTYLAISFIVMIVLLIKFGYKKIDNKLNEDIKNIKFNLNDLERLKTESNEEIIRLKQELHEVNDSILQAVSKAEQKANEITENSNKNIEKALRDKQADYEAIHKRIEQSFLVDLKNKLVSLILKDLEKKIKESKDSREFQNDLIENSIEHLEDLVKKYIK